MGPIRECRFGDSLAVDPNGMVINGGGRPGAATDAHIWTVCAPAEVDEGLRTQLDRIPRDWKPGPLHAAAQIPQPFGNAQPPRLAYP